jgi:hypothetical protein
VPFAAAEIALGPCPLVTGGRIHNAIRRPGGLRPSISIAGVMPAGPQAELPIAKPKAA